MVAVQRVDAVADRIDPPTILRVEVAALLAEALGHVPTFGRQRGEPGQRIGYLGLIECPGVSNHVTLREHLAVRRCVDCGNGAPAAAELLGHASGAREQIEPVAHDA